MKAGVIFTKIETDGLKYLETLSDGNTGSFTMPVDFSFEEIIEIVSLYTFVDILARVGGLFISLQWMLFGILGPFLILYFLYKLALIIQTKYSKAYREGLNDVATKSFYQLVKIKMLALKSDEWKCVSESELS